MLFNTFNNLLEWHITDVETIECLERRLINKMFIIILYHCVTCSISRLPTHFNWVMFELLLTYMRTTVNCIPLTLLILFRWHFYRESIWEKKVNKVAALTQYTRPDITKEPLMALCCRCRSTSGPIHTSASGKEVSKGTTPHSTISNHMLKNA